MRRMRFCEKVMMLRDEKKKVVQRNLVKTAAGEGKLEMNMKK